MNIKSKKYAGVYHKNITNDKSYYITYKDQGKKVWLKIGLHSQGVREAYCHKKRVEVTSKLRLGELPDMLKKKHSKTFDTIMIEFFNHKTYPPATKKMYEGRYHTYAKSIIGHKAITAITQKDIQTIHEQACKKLSLKTAELIIVLINSMFIYAIDKKYTDINPVKKFKFPKIDNARDRFLDKEEMALLIEEVRGDADLLLFVMIALTTGGRLTAICSLKKKDVALATNTINLRDDKNDETYQAFLSSKVKPLLDFDGLKPNDSIFNKQQRTIQRKLQSILNTLFNKGLSTDDRKNRVVVHTLRHTFASHLAINGTPIFTIQKLMNHKDITHTIRYAKLAPDSGRDMVEGII